MKTSQLNFKAFLKNRGVDKLTFCDIIIYNVKIIALKREKHE